MRPRDTIALPDSFSTCPKCRTGQITIVTCIMKANSSPTESEPAARNMPPAISTMQTWAVHRKSLTAQYAPLKRFSRSRLSRRARLFEPKCSTS